MNLFLKTLGLAATVGVPAFTNASAQAVVSTLAGTGVAGSLNGPGYAARFDQPYGVAADSAGNVYIADYIDHRIRKLDPVANTMSTLAGNGTPARAYPNPSRQEAWVDFVAQEAGERAALEVRSPFAGQTLATWAHTAAAAGRQTEPLPLAKLPAGLYVCRITTPAGASVVRVTKE